MTGEYKVGGFGNLIAQSCGVSSPEFDPKLASLFQPKKPLKRLAVKPTGSKVNVALPPPAKAKVKPQRLMRNKEAADIRIGAKAKFQPSQLITVIQPQSALTKVKKPVTEVKLAASSDEVPESTSMQGNKQTKGKKLIEAGGGGVKVKLTASETKTKGNKISKIKKNKKGGEVKLAAFEEKEEAAESTKTEAPENKVTKSKKKNVKLATGDSVKEEVAVKRSKVKKDKVGGEGVKKTVDEQNAPKEKDPELESRTVYVGNVPKDMGKKQLLKLFRQFGDIETLRLRCGAPDKPKRLKKVAINKKEVHPDRNSVAAYIRYETREEAEEAMKNGNGIQIQDHHLIVDLADKSNKKDNKKAIFVGNIHLKMQDDELWSFFEDCGRVESVRIIRDRDTGMGKGFGYVNFHENSSVELALQKDGTDLKNRALRISRCVKKLKSRDDSTGGGGSQNSSGTKNSSIKRRSQGRKQRGEVMEFGGDTTAEIGKFKRKSAKPNLTDVKKARVAKQLATGAPRSSNRATTPTTGRSSEPILNVKPRTPRQEKRRQRNTVQKITKTNNKGPARANQNIQSSKPKFAPRAGQTQGRPNFTPRKVQESPSFTPRNSEAKTKFAPRNSKFTPSPRNVQEKPKKIKIKPRHRNRVPAPAAV